MNRRTLAFFILLAVALSGCRPKSTNYEELLTTLYTPDYAPGFIIYGLEEMESTLIRITNPWQGAEGMEMNVFVQRNGELPPWGYHGEVLPSNPERIVALSSTYVAMLDLLGEVDRVVAVSGKQYIANPYVADDANGVVDLGEMMEYERLAAAQPDLVLLYGVDDAQTSMTNRLTELAIPYMYMAEYLEELPLGRAEWLVVLAEILDQRELGERIFGEIAEQYERTLELTSSIPEDEKPLVMLNMPYNDAWFLPSEHSYMSQLIRDAGATPITGSKNRGESSTIGLEQAYLHLSEAPFWLHTGQATQYSDLPLQIREHANQILAIQKDQIYNNNARTTPAGGSDYFESGVVAPHIILTDLVEIFHPELLEHDLYYYHKISTKK